MAVWHSSAPSPLRGPARCRPPSAASRRPEMESESESERRPESVTNLNEKAKPVRLSQPQSGATTRPGRARARSRLPVEPQLEGPGPGRATVTPGPPAARRSAGDPRDFTDGQPSAKWECIYMQNMTNMTVIDPPIVFLHGMHIILHII